MSEAFCDNTVIISIEAVSYAAGIAMQFRDALPPAAISQIIRIRDKAMPGGAWCRLGIQGIPVVEIHSLSPMRQLEFASHVRNVAPS